MGLRKTLNVLRKSQNDKRGSNQDVSLHLLARFVATLMAAITALVFVNLCQAFSAGPTVLPTFETYPSFKTSGSISVEQLAASGTAGLAYNLRSSPSSGSGTSNEVANLKQDAVATANAREPQNNTHFTDLLVTQERKRDWSAQGTSVLGRTKASPSSLSKPDSNSKKPSSQRPSSKSRFDVPWNRIPETPLLSLAESGHRVLLSSISSYANSGLGHMMAVLNLEVRTSMILGLTYTHRQGIYGALDIRNSTVTSRVDDFFGWGRDEIARDDVYQNFCEGESGSKYLNVGDIVRNRTHQRPCRLCRGVRNPGFARTTALRGMNVSRIVQVPLAVSLSPCRPQNDPELISFRCGALKAMRDKHNETKQALFQVGVSVCDKFPAQSDFSQTKGWFYWRYWRTEVVQLRNELQYTDPRTPRDRFADTELSIAIHARRGDFLEEANLRRGRVLVSMRTYAVVVRNIIEIVRREGGHFSDLPVRVYVYSEGRRGKHVPNSDAHDVSTMTTEFLDSDGVCLIYPLCFLIENIGVFSRTLTMRPALIMGLQTYSRYSCSTLQVILDGKWIANLMGHNVRVSMRVSTPTLLAVHEMTKADWFIGSASGLSTNVVGTLGRGIHLLPMRSCGAKIGLVECFDPTNGNLPTSGLSNLWREYSNTFQHYISGQFERP